MALVFGSSNLINNIIIINIIINNNNPLSGARGRLQIVGQTIADLRLEREVHRRVITSPTQLQLHTPSQPCRRLRPPSPATATPMRANGNRPGHRTLSKWPGSRFN
jgi:hypothetical protein